MKIRINCRRVCAICPLQNTNIEWENYEEIRCDTGYRDARAMCAHLQFTCSHPKLADAKIKANLLK